MRNLIFTLLFLGAQAFADVGSSTLSDISTGGSSGGGSGDVVGPSSSTDGHAVLFDGPTGKLIKVATGTGYAYVTSGVFSVKSGTSAQYLRADGTVSTLDTSAVAEGSNLYFTNARAIASTLTGYTSGAGTVASSDTVLQAIQKLNGNVAARGDFSGPASSTDNAIVAFDGPGGKTGKNTTVTVGTNQIQVYPHATSDTAVKGSAGTMTLRVGGTDAWYIDYSGAPQLRPAGSSYPVLKANANGNVDRGIWLLTGNLGTITHANYYSGQIGYSGSGPYTPTISAWKSTASQSLVMGYASGDDFPTVSDGTIKVKTGTNLTLDADRVVVKNSVTPASASATCVTGTQAWDSSYVYVCVATDTWKRAALSTW